MPSEKAIKTPEQWASYKSANKDTVPLYQVIAMAQEEARAEQHTKTWVMAIEAAAGLAWNGVDVPHPTVEGEILRGWDKSVCVAKAIRTLPCPPINESTKDE